MSAHKLVKHFFAEAGLIYIQCLISDVAQEKLDYIRMIT